MQALASPSNLRSSSHSSLAQKREKLFLLISF